MSNEPNAARESVSPAPANGAGGPPAGSDQAGSPPPRRRLELHWKILIGLLIGALAGLLSHALLPHPADGLHAGLRWTIANVTKPIGQVFIRMVLMVVVPLVFCALVLGVVGVGDVRRLGRMGLRTLIWTIVLSGLSVVVGITLVNAVQPGRLLSDEKRAAVAERYGLEAARMEEQAGKAKGVLETLLDIIPRNPLQEMVGALDGSSPGGGMLAVMFFALIFGIALSQVGERGAGLVSALDGAYETLMCVIGYAMALAPYAVAALMFSLAAELGLEILSTLGGFAATVLGGLGIQLIVVYGLMLSLAGGRNPLRFFIGASEALMTAFATSSSNATLPTSLRVAEHDLRIRPDVSRFVLTVGATANQNGTALFEGVTVLFLAQVFGVDLSLPQQITVALMSVLAGIGTAGVPGGSIPLIVIVLQSVGVPAEGIGIILGIDRLLDMCRTSVNVAGDLAIAACVNRAEGGLGSAGHVAPDGAGPRVVS